MFNDWKPEKVREEQKAAILAGSHLELTSICEKLGAPTRLISYLLVRVRPNDERPIWPFPHRWVGVFTERPDATAQPAAAADFIPGEIPTYLREYWIRALRQQVVRFMEVAEARSDAPWRIVDRTRPCLVTAEDAVIPNCPIYATDSFKPWVRPLRVINAGDLGTTLAIAKRLHLQSEFHAEAAESSISIEPIKPETVFLVKSLTRSHKYVVKFDHPSAIEAEVANTALIRRLLGENARVSRFYSGVRSSNFSGDAIGMLVSEFTLPEDRVKDLPLSRQWRQCGNAPFDTAIAKVLDVMTDVYAKPAPAPVVSGVSEDGVVSARELFDEYFARRHSFVPQLTFNNLRDFLPHCTPAEGDGRAMTVSRMRWLSASGAKKLMTLAVELHGGGKVLLLRFDGLAHDESWHGLFADLNLRPGEIVRLRPASLIDATTRLATASDILMRAKSLLSARAFCDRHGETYPDPIDYVKSITNEQTTYPVLRRYIHGDLKLDNILADVRNVVSDPLIVDLASVRLGVPDFDFARLEASIFGYVFANPRRQPNSGEQALQEAWKLQEAVEDENSTYTAEPLTLLRSIRRARLKVIAAASETDPAVATNPNGEQTAHRVCLCLSYLDLAIKAANRAQSPSPEFLSLYAAAAHHLRALQTD